MIKQKLQEFEYFSDEEEYLRYAWIALTTHFDKPAALWFAHKGLQSIDNQ